MDKFEVRFAETVLRYRWLIILLTLVAVGVAGYGAKNLKFTTNYRVFFSPDNPQLLAFEALENTYNKSDNVMFVLSPNDAKVFSAKSVEAVKWLTEQAWQLPYSTRVDSISNFQHTKAQGDDLLVSDLVADDADLSDSRLREIRDIALSEPALRRALVATNESVTAVNVVLQLPGENETVEIPAVVRAARALAKKTEAKYPFIDVRLPGMVMMNNAFAEASKRDLSTLVPVSFLIMILFLIALLKGFSGSLTTALVILLSIITAMGLGGWLGFPITPPSASAPTIILTIAIANCVHVLVSFLQGMRGGASKHDAMVESLRVNVQPVFLASLTTALGFLTMNFSEVPPFRDLGNFVAMGIAASFVMSVTLLPAVVTLLPARVKAQGDSEDRMMAAFGDFVVKNRRVLLWSMTAVTLVLVASIPRNELNDIFVHYFDKSVEFRADADYVDEHLVGSYRLDYTLEAAEAGGISDPAFLVDLKKFADWYESQPETKHVSVLTDVMTRLNKNMHGDDEAWEKLPEERDLAAQYLLLYEMSLPYGLDLNNQINIDKSATRMVVTVKVLSSNELIALEKRADTWLANNTPAIAGKKATGTTLMFAHIGKRNIKSMLLGTTIALILISAVLIVALRSVKMGLISLLPNLIPGAMGFGLWGLMVGEVGLALSVVTGMTLGIVVDDTVHFLSKYRRARTELGFASPDAVRYAFKTVGRALVITSIVLVAGFLVLSTSTFALNSGMGLLTAIVIVFALVADFLLLPPLLMKLEEKGDEDMGVATSAVPGAAG
ncbi:MAG: MMPL family transporter [Gammaproteobacteria bacterium]|nr:MMPL family transporter [Gammaproteobacteria bacterium]